MALNKTILDRTTSSTRAPSLSGSIATTWAAVEVWVPYARVDAGASSVNVYVERRRQVDYDLTSEGTPSNAAVLTMGAVESYGNPHPGLYPWYLFVASVSSTPTITIQGQD